MKLPLLAALFALPLVCHSAIRLDNALMCNSSSFDFFNHLIQGDLINPQPYKVDAYSVNYFHPKLLRNLTTNGMVIESVFGFINGQLLFRKTTQQAPVNNYGVIVNESIANVQAELNSIGSSAKTLRINHSSTAVLCTGV
jgi:hypothetical protein